MKATATPITILAVDPQTLMGLPSRKYLTATIRKFLESIYSSRPIRTYAGRHGGSATAKLEKQGHLVYLDPEQGHYLRSTWPHSDE